MTHQVHKIGNPEGNRLQNKVWRGCVCGWVCVCGGGGVENFGDVIDLS